MSGYAFYVWTSYGLAFLVLLLNFIIPLKHERKLLYTLARKSKRQNRDNHYKQKA
ncbi:heme exporter protein CcmD [Candidatus Marithrix sp. Canyon 246]|nr:heme exporter protein CcmD [Candidatus Marithrix sp. Canyon 246]